MGEICGPCKPTDVPKSRGTMHAGGTGAEARPLRRHLATGLCAATARIRTYTAVLGMCGVTLALLRARFTRVGACPAEAVREGTSAGHGADRGGAGVGAITIDPYAGRHHCDVFFVEAGVRAHLAGYEARDTRLEAVVEPRSLLAQVHAELDRGHLYLP